jgi:uncharacterized protein (DUF4415 family)
MTKKIVTTYLDLDIVEKLKKIKGKYGKMSPVINEMLREFLHLDKKDKK